MNNKKKGLFATPKRIAIFVVCVVVFLVIIGIAIAIAVAAARNPVIGDASAREFAFADAGVDPASVDHVRTELDFEQGKLIYEIEFMADGVEYDYWINASDGSVLKREKDSDGAWGMNDPVSGQITMADAVEIALADAGVTLDEVTYLEEKLDTESGGSTYDITFYAGDTRYVYEVDTGAGVIYGRSREIGSQQPENSAGSIGEPSGNGPGSAGQPSGNGAGSAGQPSGSGAGSAGQPSGNSNAGTTGVQSVGNQVDLEEAKGIAFADAGVSASEVTVIKERQDYDDGILVYDIEFYTVSYEYDYEIVVATGEIRSRDTERLRAGNTSGGSAGNGGSGTGNGNGNAGAGNNGAENGDIGLDQAKSIAVVHAGFDVSDVLFSKAELDYDDGYTVYEIEFRKNGLEYEYEINALTGEILKYHSDRDD